MEITDEVLPLSKCWRYLVDVKIVKIRHLIGHISYKNQNKKKHFFVKRNIMLWHIYQILSSLLRHLHFFVHFFFTFVEQVFFGHPISYTRTKSLGKPFRILKSTLTIDSILTITCWWKGNIYWSHRRIAAQFINHDYP